MMRTGIPVSVLEREGGDVIATVLDLINADEQRLPDGVIDPSDPSTIPEEWRP